MVVLRSTPVVIDEAFFARCDQADCTTLGTMWFGVNRSRSGEEPFISQRWDEVMHLARLRLGPYAWTPSLS